MNDGFVERMSAQVGGWFAAQREALAEALFGDVTHDGRYEPTPAILLQQLATQPRMAGMLPYDEYLPDERMFTIGNDGLGFVLETTPQTGSNEQAIRILQGLYHHLPAGTGVQTFLVADNNILGLLEEYARLRPRDDDWSERAIHRGREERNDNVFRVMARRTVSHFLKGSRRSMFADTPFLVKHFRLLISVVLPFRRTTARVEEAMLIRDRLRVILQSAEFPSIDWDADDLLRFTRRWLNPQSMFLPRPPEFPDYDDGLPIKAQCVPRDAICRVLKAGLRYGQDDTVDLKLYSVIGLPKRFALWQMGDLLGDLYQPALQYTCPFMIVQGVHVLDHESVKSSALIRNARAQKNARSEVAQTQPTLTQEQQDWAVVAERLADGSTLVEMYHQLVLATPTEQANHAEQAALALWRSRGFSLAPDTYVQMQALLASMPMTLTRPMRDDLKRADRIYRRLSDNAIHLAPMLGEWAGTSRPVLLPVGRLGQLCPLDFYANQVAGGNFNVSLAGAPGSGKTMLMNQLALAYHSIGAQVWIIDIGLGYERLCKTVGGTFVQFKRGLCINPFSSVLDITEDIKLLKPLLAVMASGTDTPLSRYQLSRLEEGIGVAWAAHGNAAEITFVADALRAMTLPDGSPDAEARKLAVELFPYCAGGMYEHYFCGQANVDLTGDFVVLEMEELKQTPDLALVVLFLLMFRITSQMYASRERPKLGFLDEAWQHFKKSTEMIADIIEELYRRARRYRGLFVSGTQGVGDYFETPAARAAWKSSDWHILLRQNPEEIEGVIRRGDLHLPENQKRQLLSLRTESGRYSEALVRSPLFNGVLRFAFDPYSQLMATSNADDFTVIDQRLASGMPLQQALESILDERGIDYA